MIRTSTGRMAAAGAGLLLALSVAGCGSSESTPSASESMMSAPAMTAAPGDVQFAQMMIPHHEQAVEMAELALADQAGASSEVKGLADQIATAQEPEIATMNGWLSEWGTTAMGMDHDMDGMMSDQQMGDLSGATGPDFDRQWLTMMIEHHQGALSMADSVLGTTDDPRVSELAQQIVQGQKAEISTMQGLLRAG